MAGLFSVALVVILFYKKRKRPDVIRLAALRCSDFPLLPDEQKRLPDLLQFLQGLLILAKIVEHSKLKFCGFKFRLR